MKILFLFITLTVSLTIFAELESPFVGTIEGLSIPNSHYVIDELIIRGQTPRNKDEYLELLDLGVKNVLIFKKETKNEVQTEIKTLNSLGIKNLHISFPWKDILEFTPVCMEVKKALIWLEAKKDAGEKSFFHCTVGEDRTGLLAGLILYNNNSSNVKNIFEEELCQKGYEAGDPNKASNISKLVRENLTPVFLKMAYLNKMAKFNPSKINCAHNFNEDSHFSASIYAQTASFRCGY
jgi:protein tyrosine/serine phosphatase